MKTVIIVLFTLLPTSLIFGQGSVSDAVIDSIFQTLDEVVVSGQKSTYITRIDKKIFNAGNDLMSASGSASDLMQNIPSVQVDMDGNVSLRGSENVQILINGKSSTLMGASRATILQQIPANTIDRIEIITNPSARYKPDGTAGIINIILKKEKRAGVNGSLIANAGNDNRYNSTLSLNYNPGKINFFGSYGIRFDDRNRYTFDKRTKTDSLSLQNTFIEQNTNSNARPVSHLIRGGMDWDITKKDNFQLSAGYIDMRFRRDETTTNIHQDNSGNTLNNYTRYRADDEYQKDFEWNAVYEHTFGEDHLLSVDYTHSSAKEQEDNKYTNQYFVPEKPDSKDNTLIRQNETENLIRADYTRPLNEHSKLDAGTEIELDRAGMDYFAENLLDGAWITDRTKTNHFIFDENIYALYATYEAEFGKFAVTGGLRGEMSRIKSRLISTGTVIPNNGVHLFPTLHTSFHLDEKNELQLNYSLRINRPEGDDLNPFPEYRDPLNVHSGNPYLKPEKIHSLEWGYLLKSNATTFAATLYHREMFNRMTEITKYVNDSVLWTTKENMSSSRSSGLELIINSAFGNRATVNVNSNIFYNVIDAGDLGYGSNKSAVSWYAALNGNFNITKCLMAQLNTRYTSKALTPQGYREPSFIMNTGARYSLFNNKAYLLFTVSDLLNTYRSVTSH
ncbi:TonB-dependent receptor [Clostridia bacterium]|nr:TonB-dependent receptor [Clostridia bacterium]